MAAFGRAFGTLPDNISETTKEQKDFLKQSVAGLAEEGKVICVRLGVVCRDDEGQGVDASDAERSRRDDRVLASRFLEETFSASTAPPEHRYHQKAARAVLKDLLPDSGTDIKGYMRSHAELLEASGYGNRPKDFDDLIRILDSEIRLITPTDPEGKDADDDSVTQTEAGQKYFQLTHDYLVHSLRDWLTRKQKETRKGRAELKLFDTSVTWNAKPENRFLPSWWECLNIRLLTDKKKWTEPQRKMMLAAAKVYGLTWGGTLTALLVLGLSVQYLFAQRDWNNKRVQTRIAAESLQNNLGPSIPVNIGELKKLPESLVLEELAERFATDNSRHKLALAFGLAAYDRVETEYFVSRVDDIATVDTANFVDALALDRERALTTIKAEADRCMSEYLWRRKAKLAIAALALGDAGIAADMCQYENRPDPTQRTLFIHEFPQWEWHLPNRSMDLSELAQLVAESTHSGLRSGLSLAVGRIPVDQLQERNPTAHESWSQLGARWFEEHPDTSTHSAASWLLRKWKRPLPTVADQAQVRAVRDWFVNSAGMTMLRIRPTAAEPEPEFTFGDPLEGYRTQVKELQDIARDRLTKHQRRTRAIAYFQTGDHAAALADLEGLIEDPNMRNRNQMPLPVFRILALSRLGRHNDAATAYDIATETTSKWVDMYLTIQLATFRGDYATSLESLAQASHDETMNDIELYNAACAAALCAQFLSETDVRTCQKFKTFSLALLERWIDAGNWDGQHSLSQEPDFRVLHGDPEFAMLVGKIYLAKPKSDYWIASCEVTRGQFEAFIQDSNYNFEKPTDRKGVESYFSPTAEHPAQQVSWYDAVMYCNWLSRREGKVPAYRKIESKERSVYDSEKIVDQWELEPIAIGYRLPSEEEWEFAARAGSTTAWNTGADEQLLVDYCQMHPSKLSEEVADKLPNAWGLHNMHGNVEEWCNDLYDDDLPPDYASRRVYRGGSWYAGAEECKSTYRNISNYSEERTDYNGFRLALSSPSGVSGLAEQGQDEVAEPSSVGTD